METQAEFSEETITAPGKWLSPLNLRLRLTDDSMSFRDMQAGETGLPVAPHPAAYGVQRQHHTHEGIDLYAPDGTLVFAVEAGTVVAVIPFTGPHAGLPWWLDTWAVFVEGASGVVVYGEISPLVRIGWNVSAGDCVGKIIQVLAVDKGRPMCMLHLELHEAGSRQAHCWTENAKPDPLRDPLPYLLHLTID